MDTYDILLYGSYLLIIVGSAVAILLPLFQAFSDPKSLLKTAAGVIGIVVLFFIAYSISSDEVLPKFQSEQIGLTPELSKLIGGLLITTYFLAVVAIVGIVVTEITRAVK